MYEYLKDVRPTHGLEIVFVSSDRDLSSFEQYFSTMPWRAIPFEHLPFVKQNLNSTYGVNGIPSLVVLDAVSGQVVISPSESRQAVAMACRRGEQAIDSMLESWLDRTPTDTRELLSMLQLSCEEEEHEKATEYLVTKKEKSMPQATNPSESGPLNGKAIQIGPHKSINSLDHAFATCMERNPPHMVADVLSTTLKYLKNASKEPWAPKYRTFKLSNKVADQITRAEGGLGLLQSLGFDIFGTSQDFRANIPVSSDLKAMTDNLTILLSSMSAK
eukprot:scaffold119_cov131-Cylindrotheca_fusiformis.AAC.11